jgi:glutathione S-transferase
MTLPTLYHCREARSFRCVWTAEELGIEYALETMPFPPRLHVPSYKEINPLGTIPCWVDGDVNMTESAAICQVMARGSALEVLPDEADYPLYLNWLHRSDHAAVQRVWACGSAQARNRGGL